MQAKTKLASPLSRKALLVGVNVRVWTARKMDKKVTDKTNRDHNACADAGRYNKLLIEAKRLEGITTLASQARKIHYTMTKAWTDEGLRILPNVLHQKFADAFRVVKRRFDSAVDEFVADYPQFVEERKRALNGMFDAADYPPAEQIRSKFELHVNSFPVPDADDFRSDVLDDDTVEDIKRELTATSDNVLQAAMKDTAQQIATVVGHMAEKLKSYKTDGSFFTASMVENVRDLAELLPAFNLTNDPAMAKLTKRIKKELCADDATTLRHNEKVRESVQKSADDILRDVSDLLG